LPTTGSATQHRFLLSSAQQLFLPANLGYAQTKEIISSEFNQRIQINKVFWER